MTTDGTPVSPDLIARASAFADDITSRVQRVVRTEKHLSALLMPGRNGGRVMVGIVEGDDFGTFPLYIDNKHRLDLLIKFNCCMDSSGRHLATDASWLHVTPKGEKAPLFRYEYVREFQPGVPCAHLHVHGHRDEFAFVMQDGPSGRPKARKRRHEVPRLAKFHFPLGGHRFRPCVEDVLQAVVEEFSVDTVEGWRNAVGEGREEWRKLQLLAAVRDAPGIAARALEELHYKVVPPDSAPADNQSRMRAY
ncbi:hypothetical protein IW249_001354 [Micromonospora vinacea]|uniref:Uncharacterized protein n=1 Tax=Micromonospora vinacea TaxID=709878 RepID=A0ABS0JX59_9ACTN|nr:hypothetical protein [Micromonospora vinacea]MBG6100940.1 hypothetical protein [Micromonospora vinacea]